MADCYSDLRRQSLVGIGAAIGMGTRDAKAHRPISICLSGQRNPNNEDADPRFVFGLPAEVIHALHDQRGDVGQVALSVRTNGRSPIGDWSRIDAGIGGSRDRSSELRKRHCLTSSAGDNHESEGEEICRSTLVGHSIPFNGGIRHQLVTRCLYKQPLKDLSKIDRN